MKQKILVTLVLIICVTNLSAQNNIRIKENFDFDWRFTLSDRPEYATVDYNDKTWDTVQLPHDWNIQQEFDIKCGGSAAYLPEGIGWYRKTFKIPSHYNGKKISILFDGIFQQSDVYVNGKHLGFRPYGFCSIEYDLTPYLNADKENVIAVRVNTTGGRPRWYAGAGIYRHVWLQAFNPVHITTYGTYITTPSVSTDKAEVHIVTTMKNSTDKTQTLTISQQVLDARGKAVTQNDSKKLTLPSQDTSDLKQILSLNHPQLWNLENPQMYQMETIIRAGSKIIDIYRTPFGVRTFKFDPKQGFSLNGKQIKLKGMCLHQDAGSMGVAVPDRSYERRL